MNVRFFFIKIRSVEDKAHFYLGLEFLDLEKSDYQKHLLNPIGTHRAKTTRIHYTTSPFLIFLTKELFLKHDFYEPTIFFKFQIKWLKEIVWCKKGFKKGGFLKGFL